ncbi:MAG: NAD-dependent epimerase/dehydratase [Sediminibacterium sp.]
MRILITGGFGFIGGRLGQHLINSGHEIILGTRNKTNAPAWLPGAETVQTKWDSDLSLQNACNSIDAIIHTAGKNSQDCMADPVAALTFNGEATARLVNAAAAKKVNRFIYFSTAHVYANPLSGIINENTSPQNLHPYALSHRAGELAVLAGNTIANSVVVRLSNSFGKPVQKEVNCWQLLVNDLCKQAVETGRLVLHSSGLQQRDFITLTDVCVLTARLISFDDTKKMPGIVNAGSSNSCSVLDMAKRVQERCNDVIGFTPTLHYKEAAPGEKHPVLEYQARAYKDIQFVPGNDYNKEIDNLLLFCQANFGGEKK